MEAVALLQELIRFDTVNPPGNERAAQVDVPLSGTVIASAAPMQPELQPLPFVPAERIEPIVPVPSRVIDFVIVTVPKPPGSRTEISPLAAVLEIAPAKVLQGAVRLHGLTSSPTPETQVRVA